MYHCILKVCSLILLLKVLRFSIHWRLLRMACSTFLTNLVMLGTISKIMKKKWSKLIIFKEIHVFVKNYFFQTFDYKIEELTSILILSVTIWRNIFSFINRYGFSYWIKWSIPSNYRIYLTNMISRRNCSRRIRFTVHLINPIEQYTTFRVPSPKTSQFFCLFVTQMLKVLSPTYVITFVFY